MKACSNVMLLLPLLLSGQTLAQDQTTGDAQKLQGTWQAVSLEMNGKAMPEQQRKELSLVFKGDKATVKHGENTHGEYTFSMDSTKKPKQMDWTDAKLGKKGLCIFELEGDTLKVCIGEKEGVRPTEFASKAGDHFTLGIWKRAK